MFLSSQHSLSLTTNITTTQSFLAFRFATGTDLIGCGQKRCKKNGGLDLRFGFTENFFLVLGFGG